MKTPIPLSDRRSDILFIGFFLLNLLFITYIVDLEQLVIADPENFEYPWWPPPFLIDMVHWWGRNFDPLQWARPPWWRATIWIDALYFGPFYAFAIYAFWKGRNWIVVPALVWAGMMLSNVIIIMFEELIGPNHTPEAFWVSVANLPWLTDDKQPRLCDRSLATAILFNEIGQISEADEFRAQAEDTYASVRDDAQRLLSQ